MKSDPAQGDSAFLVKYPCISTFVPTFADKVLPMDTAVAQRCAKLHVLDPCFGRDVIITATTLVHDLRVVTCNMDDFFPKKTTE